MTRAIGIQDIIKDLHGPLELSVCGLIVSVCLLTPARSYPEPLTLAGPFDGERHALCEVLGLKELARFNAYSAATRRRLLVNRQRAGLGILVVADGATMLTSLLPLAADLNLTVLCTPRAREAAINALRAYLTRAFARKTIVHGVLMEVLDRGVLIRGPSHIGKSELALDLINRGHRLIADDAPEIMRLGPNHLEGTCPELLRGFLEVRGLGVLNIPAMFGNNAIKQSKRLTLIVELTPLGAVRAEPDQRLWGMTTRREILGVAIPAVILPLSPGSQIAVLVEAAVRNHQLRSHGYNAADDLVARQQRLIDDMPLCD